MPDIALKAEINTDFLRKGMELAARWTRRTPAQACNQVALDVCVEAQKLTPFVEVQKMDAELSVMKVPKIGARGKPLKGKFRQGGKVGPPSYVDDVPFVNLIIMARANPSSRYNRLTDSRYLLQQSPFKGVSRAAGMAAMAELVHRMVAARHSSGHFLGAGYVQPIRDLAMAERGRAYSQGPRATPKTGGNQLGQAIPAIIGSDKAAAVIENNVGEGGKNQANRQRALITYGANALQQAVDNRGKFAMDYFLRKSTQLELEPAFNAACR